MSTGVVRPNVGGSSGWVLRNSDGVVLRAIGTTYPELVSTKLLAGQVLSNPGGAIVEEILQLQKGAPAWRLMTVHRSGDWPATFPVRLQCPTKL
ncbi:hypothetical protein LINPERHAP1_LOCUS30735 [Linum perenne]